MGSTILGFTKDDLASRVRSKTLEARYPTDPVLWIKEKLGEYCWSKQGELFESLVTHSKTMVLSANGIGKDLPLTTPLATPTGWTTMGEVQVGDYLLDEMGKPTKVVTKSEVFHNELFKMTFSDGAEMVSSGTHLWNTLDFNTTGRLRRKPSFTDYRELWDYTETRETREIAATLTHRGNRNHYIPINSALQLDERELPIDPYVLGAWLGDGSSHAPMITLGENKQHILERLHAAGYETKKLKNDLLYSFAGQGFLELIRENGLWKNKHIPAEYLRASEAQRLELLRGLMDTDGFNLDGKSNTGVGIDLMNKQLAEDLVELVRTLGARCSINVGRTYLNGEDVGPRYRLVFNPVFEPFSPGSPKSKARPTSGAQRARRTVRTVVSVEPTPTVPTQCVTVDSPRNLYLAGPEMLVTHNSYSASRAVAWFVDVHNVHETTVVTTATNWNQVKNVVWKEIARAHKKGDLDGYINKQAEWIMPGKQDPIAFGKKPRDDDETGFQGVHDKHVLVVIDEAGGVSKELFTAVDAITTNRHARVLAILNPNDPSCYAAEIWEQQSRLPVEEREWNLIQISAFDSPNFTDEAQYMPEEALSALVQPAWVESRRREWGEDDPRYIARVLGEWPDVSATGLFNLGRVTQSMQNYGDFEVSDRTPVTLGVDVAYQGDDYSVVVSNRGGLVKIEGRYQHLDAPDLCRKIADIIADYAKQGIEVSEVRIDGVGIGHATYLLIDNYIPSGIAVYNIKGSNKSPDNSQWYNYRAAMYDFLRDAINAGDIALPEDEDLYREIRSIQYEFRGTALLIMSKSEMRKKRIKSPDILDAVAYATLDHNKLAGLEDELVTSDNIIEEFDALDFDLWNIFPA